MERVHNEKSASWKTCSTKRVQHKGSAARGNCTMEKAKHEKSATEQKVQHENSAAWTKYRDRANFGKSAQEEFTIVDR